MSLASTTSESRFGPVLPPEFIPSPLVRAVFDGTEQGTALRCETETGPITLLPWSSSEGRVAGYRSTTSGDRVPAEFTAKELYELLRETPPREIPLDDTAASTLLGHPGERDVAVSWHARVRWAERVSPDTYPEARIREALKESVRLARNQGWYHPEYDVRIPLKGPGPIFEDRLNVDRIAVSVIEMSEDLVGYEP